MQYTLLRHIERHALIHEHCVSMCQTCVLQPSHFVLGVHACIIFKFSDKEWHKIIMPCAH